jgi:uncharacterized protein (UPF0335 family)
MSDLKSYIERITKCEEEKREVQAFIKDIYLEAKSNGFDVKALRRVVRELMKPRSELQQEEQMIETYRAEVGIEV